MEAAAERTPRPLTRRERAVGVLALLAAGVWAGGAFTVPFGVALLVAAPLSLVWLVRTRRDEPRASVPRRTALAAAGILVAGTWALVAASGGLWFALAEPWPLSLRHGPDTGYAREVFERTLGFAPPADVRALWAHDEWAGPGERIVSLRFRCDDPDAVIARIAERRRLVPVPAGERAGLPSLPGPSWWPAAGELRGVGEAWWRGGASPRAFVHVWLDRATGTIWLQDVDVA